MFNAHSEALVLVQHQNHPFVSDCCLIGPFVTGHRFVYTFTARPSAFSYKVWTDEQCTRGGTRFSNVQAATHIDFVEYIECYMLHQEPCNANGQIHFHSSHVATCEDTRELCTSLKCCACMKSFTRIVESWFLFGRVCVLCSHTMRMSDAHPSALFVYLASFIVIPRMKCETHTTTGMR